MIATMDGWVPVQHRPTVRDLARKVDAAIAGFVRGQTAVCLLLGAFYAIGLSLAGLNFGLPNTVNGSLRRAGISVAMQRRARAGIESPTLGLEART